MKKILLILLSILLVLFVSISCSDKSGDDDDDDNDDNDDNDNSSLLVGTWQNRISGEIGSRRFTFNNDGTFMQESYDDTSGNMR
jgi:hypothetical protein